MTCDEVRPYLDRGPLALTNAELAAAAGHVLACPTCQALVRRRRLETEAALSDSDKRALNEAVSRKLGKMSADPEAVATLHNPEGRP